MTTRMKMDEKNEKAVRSLLKKTLNRRCINCNSLGPQYVCLNFSTFICTQCSGIHREFTHRVKSVSMSKFTSQEVENLENGGNERGLAIYFKGWDSQRQPLPDSSNIERLREFIKMVYVDKRFSGERMSAEGRGGDREINSRRSDSWSTYRADSWSPIYEDRYDNCPIGNRCSNAGLEQRDEYDIGKTTVQFDSEENKYSQSYSKHHQYEGKTHNKHPDKRHYEDHYSRLVEENFSSEKLNRVYGSSPPIIPVREILGDNVPKLRVEVDGNQINGSHKMDKSWHGQNGSQSFGSSSSFSSVEGNVTVGAMSLTRENSRSLIDFLSEQSLPTTVTATEMTDPYVFSTVAQPSASSSSSTGWASFDTFSTISASTLNQSISLISPLESLVHISVPSIYSRISKQTADMNGNSPWTPQYAAPAASGLDPHAINNSLTSAGTQAWDAFPSILPPSIQTESIIAQPFTNIGVQEPVAASGGGATQSTVPSFATTRPSEDMINHNQPQKSRNPFDFPSDTPVISSVTQFPSLASMQAALPNFGMPSMPVTGSGMNGYPIQWSQQGEVVQLQTSHSLSVEGSSNGQHMATSIPHMMQHGMDPRITGNFFNILNQSDVSPSYISSERSVSPQYVSFQNSSYGVSDSNVEGNLSSQFPSHQSSVSMPGGNSTITDSFYLNARQWQRWLMSQHSAGSSGGIFYTDPLSLSPPPGVVQGNHHVLSHGLHGSSNILMGVGVQPPPQDSFHFNTQSSDGNPFG